jgi:tartrate-resistant acid phosphatase type 5
MTRYMSLFTRYFSISFVFLGASMFGNSQQQPSPPASTPAPPPAPSDIEVQLIQRLPAEWRAPAMRYHIFLNNGYTGYLLKSTDNNELLVQSLDRLAEQSGAEEFVAAHLDEVLSSPSPSTFTVKFRKYLLYAIAGGKNWQNSPITAPLLEHECTGNPDPDLSMVALEGLHVLEVRRMKAVVEDRMKSVSWDYKSNQGLVDQLEAEDEKLLYAEADITLPGYVMKPPPVFEVPTKSNAIRVAMMGDFGTRAEDQRKVAAAMVDASRKKPFDFGLTLGDNFYFDLASPDDPGLRTAFEDLYGPMGITFYPSLGSRDWMGETPAIELLYSTKNPHWRFPAPYYTYTAGTVQFFAINTEWGEDGQQHLFSAAQARWLQDALDKSTAKWKVVYGNMPPVTSMWKSYPLLSDLMPILKGRADVYIAGRDQTLGQFKPIDDVNLFLIGASGGVKPKVNASDPGTVFAKGTSGFGVLEADDHNLTIHIDDEDGKELHVATFHK